MFIIQAPYPALQTTTVLPHPQFSDTESILDSVSMKHAMDGTQYTYVRKRSSRRKLSWTFQLTRNKGLELRAFLIVYFSSKIQIIDHNDKVWQGHFVNNPFEYDTSDSELQTITLEFEGICVL